MNPQSNNVTPIDSKQTAPPAEFEFDFVFDGFQVKAKVVGNLAQLRAMTAKLKAEGATPVQTPAQPEKSAGVPTCPVHNTTMKPSQKPGTFFCPKKNDDGSYCKHKA